MKKIFREYFAFTKKERNGIIVLFFILFVLILIRTYFNNESYGEIVLMDDDFKKDIENFEKSLIPKKVYTKENKFLHINKNDFQKYKWYKPEILFFFDLNKVSKKELDKLGFSEKQVETLINYRKKGGVFFKKDDLLKIYGIEKEQFDILEPYIIVEAKTKEEPILKNQNEGFVAKNETVVSIEINSATKEDLMKLSGIGSYFAERIIKYRDLLGGFYKKDQLLEVYNMDSTRYLGFCSNIIIDTSKIIKLNLNETDFNTLIRHPYLNKYQTEAIMKYKELKGNFLKIEQIYQNNLLIEEEYLKLEPYLKIK